MVCSNIFVRCGYAMLACCLKVDECTGRGMVVERLVMQRFCCGGNKPTDLRLHLANAGYIFKKRENPAPFPNAGVVVGVELFARNYKKNKV